MEEKFYNLSIQSFLSEISSVQPLDKKRIEQNVEALILNYLHSIGVQNTQHIVTKILFQEAS